MKIMMKTSKEAIGIDSENKEVETTAREAIVTLLSPSLERFSSFLLCVKKQEYESHWVARSFMD